MKQMPHDIKQIILACNVNVKLCSSTRNFRKLVQQQI